MAAQANTVGTQKKTFSQWIKSRKGQQAIIIVAFMIIPLALLFTFTYLPFGEMVGYSFMKMKYIGKRQFVGWDNYASVFRRKDCFRALKLSLYYMGGSLVQLALALYLATVLSFKVKGGNIFKGFMFFPYLINGIAIGFIFKFFYTRGFVFDTVLQWCGFELDNLPYWLRDQSINNISLVGTSVWRYFGQNMVLFIGAIMSVDAELYEAAMLDGANRFHQFIYIILPSIKTIVTLNVILSITGSLSAFEPPYVITDGANGTGTYFIVMHEIAHTQQKVGLASAMAVVLLLIIFAATILQKLFFKYVFKNSEDEDFNATKRRDKKLAKQAARKAGRSMTALQKIGKVLLTFLKYFSLVFFAFVAVLPIVSCVITAFKTETEYAQTNVMELPESWLNLRNFADAFTRANMGRAFMNSTIILVSVLVVSVLVGTSLAYVLNRFQFPGNGLIRSLFLFATLLPGVAMQIAVYEIMFKLGLINSLVGYIIMMCGTDVIAIYIYIQFFENISVSLDESAIIDGASYFKIYYKILLPLLRPAIVTACILKGVGTYNEYYCANLYLQNKKLYPTVATSLYTFVGPLGSQYNLICAGVIISLLPALIVFILFQKQIYSGMTAGSVKG